MISELRRRIRGLRRPAVSRAEAPVAAARPGRLPEVEFVGYGEDCRIFGYLQLQGERLTDCLNDATSYRLVDALVEALDEDEAFELPEIVVNRDELLAVRASGPRGSIGRRGRTRPYPIELKTGPYMVHGYLHALPGSDPLLHLRRRKSMVPITEAWLEYDLRGARERARVGTVIVHRELIDWIAPSADEDVQLPDLPSEATPGPFVKDFTGSILTWRE